MNATPIQNVGLLENQRRNGHTAIFDHHSKSLNATGVVNFKTGRTAKTNDYANGNQAPTVPQ